MDDHYSLCLLGLMDRLWFHQIILFSESSIVPKTLNHQIPLLTNSLIDLPSSLSLFSSSSSSTSSSSQEEISIDSPPRNLKLKMENYFLSEKDEREEEEAKEDKVLNEKERKTRLKLSTNKTTRRSQSFSPSKKNRQQQYYYTTSIIKNSSKLQKSMSGRSLGELEMEEVKGFMDLGFIFRKEHINPRMVRVIPGLTRLGLYKNVNKTINHCDEEDEDEDKEIIRPYLSEAWLIRKPDSPLLNLRLPRVYAASDMKKHLKSWARTVASVIQQES